MSDLWFLQTPEFDEETHQYRRNGVPCPGVTEILKSAGLIEASGFDISDEVMESAAERGTLAHLAIALDVRGQLDEESVDDEIMAYVEAWREFAADTGFVAIMSEAAFYDEATDYAGTLDLAGYIGEDLAIIDLKTGSVGLKPWHKYQLAAYARPFRIRNSEWPIRLMLHLRPDLKMKKYRQYVFGKGTADWDWTVFEAAVTLHTAKELDRKW